MLGSNGVLSPRYPHGALVLGAFGAQLLIVRDCNDTWSMAFSKGGGWLPPSRPLLPLPGPLQPQLSSTTHVPQALAQSEVFLAMTVPG